MTAESHRGRVVRKNVIIALSKAQGKQIFPVCHRNGPAARFIAKLADPDSSCATSSRRSIAKTYGGPMRYGRSAQAPTLAKMSQALRSLVLWVHSLALLWQIGSRCVSLQIHFLQRGHRCGGGRAMSSRMARRTAGNVGRGGGPLILFFPPDSIFSLPTSCVRQSTKPRRRADVADPCP
jgi:hypothetical protein